MQDLYSVSAPGYFVTFAYTLAAIMYCWLCPRRFSVRKTIGIQLTGMAVICALSFVLESSDIRFYFPRMLFLYALITGLMMLCMKYSLLQVFYFFPFVMVLGEFMVALDWHLYFYGTRINQIPDVWWIRWPFFFGYYLGATVLAYLVNRRFRSFYRELEIQPKVLAELWITTLFIMLAGNISIFFPETPISSNVPTQIFQIRLLVDFTGVVLLYLFQTVYQEMQQKTQVETLNRMLELQYTNYQTLKQSVELVSRSYHDLKHQIRYLEDGQHDEERIAYLRQLKQEMQDVEAQAETGNEMLDMIVMSKRLAGQEKQIKITCISDGRQLSFLKPVDLNALFGNMLDNAMEAVSKLKDPEQRMICLTVEKKKGFLTISCENCFDGTLTFEEGRPVTTKTDAFYHGYGTQSIAAIARKYHGSASFYAKNGWFTAKVLMPAEQTKIIDP
ncbi:MAG: GHKL domain-containing protein [Blautia sp.]|nr:GHKL domain-containing protein [Blautia sp.]